MKAVLLITLALLLTSCAVEKRNVMVAPRPAQYAEKRCAPLNYTPWVWECRMPNGSCYREDRRCYPPVVGLCR